MSRRPSILYNFYNIPTYYCVRVDSYWIHSINLNRFFFFRLSSRTRYTGIPVTTLQETKKNKDRVQPQSAAQVGTRLREKPLRRGCREKTVGPIFEPNRNSGECSFPGRFMYPIYPRSARFLFVWIISEEKCLHIFEYDLNFYGLHYCP